MITKTKKQLLFLGLLCMTCLTLVVSSHAGSYSTAVGYMHPLGHQDAQVIQDIGQIFDARYGIIRHESETVLETSLAGGQNTLPVYAPYPGRVLYMETHPDKGETIVLLHRDGSKTTYSDVTVPKDTHFRKRYKKGAVIAHLKPNDQGVARLRYELVDEDGRNIRQKLRIKNRNEQNFVLNSNYLSVAFYNPDPFNENSQSQKIPPVNPWSPNSQSNTGQNQNQQPVEPDSPPVETKQSRTSTAIQPSQTGNFQAGIPPLPYTVQSYGLFSAEEDLANRSANRSQSSQLAAADLNPPDRPLCPAPTMRAMAEATQDNFDIMEAQLNATISPPPSVHDLACFDNFAADMAINVATSGIFGGPLNIFGVPVDLGRLIEIGVDAANGENCQGAQSFLEQVRFTSLPADILYTGFGLGNNNTGFGQLTPGEQKADVQKFAALFSTDPFQAGVKSLIKGQDPETGDLIITPQKSFHTGVIERTEGEPIAVFVHGKPVSLSSLN